MHSSGMSMSRETFIESAKKLYDLCGFNLRDSVGEALYDKLGDYEAQHIRNAFKRLSEAPPNKLNMAAIKGAILAVIPKRNDTDIVGCTFCDSAGLIQYVKVINDIHYTFSARCHKCNTSKYVKLPMYNEVMPHDDIKPHSTKEQMLPLNHDTKEPVRLITQREHEDYLTEQKRKRDLWLDEQRENNN